MKSNKTSLDVGKTELVLFNIPKKEIQCDLKIKLIGKTLNQTDSTKYFKIQIGKNLTWKQ